MKNPKAVMDKIMGLKKLAKLDIDLFYGKSRADLKVEYEQKKAEKIAHYMRELDYSRNKAEGQWLENYPKGFDDWVKNYRTLTGIGEQKIIDKINEIIDCLNQGDF